MIPGDRWLLPAGIEESLPRQAGRLETLRRKLLDLYHAWGYELVLTPFIEYLESRGGGPPPPPPRPAP
ncbi:MAG: ATP phosphoribosyltransferase regulatory subunit, partial [Pseudomonadota bacterium]|nr:ATP phosphoribosyltransferase regulatory subunit [Pseudomonadota bacterium]